MKLQHSLLLLISFFALLSQTTQAADAEHGKELHNSSCQSCHASLTGGDATQIYTRSERRVASHSALISQVNLCKSSVGAAWFDDDVADVVEYLNTHFYKFK